MIGNVENKEVVPYGGGDVELGFGNRAVVQPPGGTPPPPPPKPVKFAPQTMMNTISYPSPSKTNDEFERKAAASSTLVAGTSLSDEKSNAATCQKPSKRPKPTPYTLFAHNLAYGAALTNVVAGPIAMAWYDIAVERPEAADLLFANSWCGLYSLVVGIVVFAWEYAFGLKQLKWLPGEGSNGRSPVRALLYVGISVGCFFSYPTLLAGIVFVICGGANWMAFHRGEVIDQATLMKSSYLLCNCSGTSSKTVAEEGNADQSEWENLSAWERFKKWLKRQEEIGYLGQVVFVTLYILVNVILWLQRLIAWNALVAENQKGCTDLNEFDCVSNYAPLAKAFGQTLNFNCALLLVPVLKTLLRKLNNLRVWNSDCAQRFAPPLRKNIVFHKFVALFVLGGTIGHILFHALNYMASPEATSAAFTPLAFITGYIITIAMYVIYSAAQNRVKRASYEVFWWAHHFFLIFFLALLFHAPKFWAWGLVPLLAYAFERAYREFKRKKVFYVARVVYKKPVMCIAFFPERASEFVFREGQYLYVLAPSLSKWEWHPFTISSAYEDLECKNGEVTLHIRVQGPGSWTYRLCKMFEGMAPASQKSAEGFSVSLSHMDSQGVNQRGKHLGPDGLPLISIDGPHAAPAQHYSEYDEIMLVGAGIGLTPSSAILQSILKHKWKKGFLPKTVHFFFVVRHSEIFSFRWFIKLLTELEQMVASDYASGNLDRNINRLQIHLFITGAPKKQDPNERVERQPSIGASAAGERISAVENKALLRAGVNVNIGFTAEDLELAMLNPSVSSRAFVNTFTTQRSGSSARLSNQLQDIFVWNGRPGWEDIFSHVKLVRQPSTDRIGVCFCGTPFIGKDLKTFCEKYSSLSEGILFSLHKENF